MSEEKATRKPAEKKAPAKKPTAKAAAKKSAAAKKPIAKKAATKKSTATKAATPKKPAVRKTAAKPAATKKPPVKKAVAAKPEAVEKVKTTSGPAETPSDAGHAEANDSESTHQASQDAGSDMGSDMGSGDKTYTFDADDIRREFKDKDWAAVALRGAFMLLFGFLAWIAISVSFLLSGLQFIMLVLTGGPNEFLRKVIMVLGRYIVDVMQFLSFESDERPFPLGKDLPNTD